MGREGGSRSRADRLLLVVVTAGGLGYAPLGPGTVGSLLALGLAWGLAEWGAGATFLVALACAALTALLAGRAEALLGRRDPPAVILDEIAGMLLATVALPRHWAFAAAAFGCFRLLDIWKPLGIRRAQALPGGVGILADDLLAGLYTNLLLQALSPFLAGRGRLP
ncbi:MAG: phosphatidylglycerophosphatase A family protein [Candidatus Methylomirabilales bacterium]